MLECERQRIARGLSMWKVDELAGTQDGYYAKALHADAPSGRQAQWKTLQWIVDALFPRGFKVVVMDAPMSEVMDAPMMKAKLRHIGAQKDPKTRRELMADLGRKGRAAQMGKLTPQQRSRIASKAQRNRWRRIREAQRKARAAAAAPE